ncbi:MAG: SufS family cysteine desulfurase [Patescibacteria group bacterium]
MIDKNIKKDFPIFGQGLGEGQGFAYLDTAATSQTPKVVLDAMEEYYTKFRANIHRGTYKAGQTASEAYEDARASVARFIGAEKQEVIFTSGATASSNMLVSMLEHSKFQGLPLEEGGEIVTTAMEHHASLIPLQELARRHDLDLKHLPLVDNGVALNYDVVEKFITPKTKIVSVMLASNVTGVINDVARIAEVAHKVGALVVCDATAAAGHMSVDVKKLDVDFLYFSGHKMCGPTGVGVLWGRAELLKNLEPGVYGGGIVDEVTLARATWRGIPERFEAGTPNIGGVIGLGAAVKYLEKVGVDNVHAHSAKLAEEAIARLEEISGVRVIAERDGIKNVGIVSFVVEGVHPHDVAEILGREGVAIRAGHHCAMPLVTDALGVTAVSRASFYLYNTAEDIDALMNGVKKAQAVFEK